MPLASNSPSNLQTVEQSPAKEACNMNYVVRRFSVLQPEGTAVVQTTTPRAALPESCLSRGGLNNNTPNNNTSAPLKGTPRQTTGCSSVETVSIRRITPSNLSQQSTAYNSEIVQHSYGAPSFKHPVQSCTAGGRVMVRMCSPPVQGNSSSAPEKCCHVSPWNSMTMTEGAKNMARADATASVTGAPSTLTTMSAAIPRKFVAPLPLPQLPRTVAIAASEQLQYEGILSNDSPASSTPNFNLMASPSPLFARQSFSELSNLSCNHFSSASPVSAAIPSNTERNVVSFRPRNGQIFRQGAINSEAHGRQHQCPPLTQEGRRKASISSTGSNAVQQVPPCYPFPMYFMTPQMQKSQNRDGDASKLAEQEEKALAGGHELYKQYISAATMYNQWMMSQIQQMTKQHGRTLSLNRSVCEESVGSITDRPIMQTSERVEPSSYQDSRVTVSPSLACQDGSKPVKVNSENQADSVKQKTKDRAVKEVFPERVFLSYLPYDANSAEPDIFFPNFRVSKRPRQRFGGICC